MVLILWLRKRTQGLVTVNQTSLEVTRNMAKALTRTQYYPPDRMKAYQRKLLEPLLRHARKEVPFYATRLDPLFAGDDSIRWEAWNDIPTITRPDAHEAGEALFAKSYPDMMGPYTENQTSGSTGIAFKFRAPAITRILSSAASQRIFDWHNVDCSGKMAFIVDVKQRYPFPKGGIERKWNVRETEAPAYHLSVSELVRDQLQWLLETKADILNTYPSIALAMANLAKERGISLPIHTFIGHGEVFDLEARKALTNEHGLKVIDRYGASELGPIAAECPQSSLYHQFSEASMMDVLGLEDNTPIIDGRGRLVLTPFYNYAMPLIRYESHDQVEITSQACSCGRTLPCIQKILGRERNVFTYVDGTQSWPTVPETAHRAFFPAKQIQVIQKTFANLEVRFVRDDASTASLNVEKVEAVFQKHLHPSIKLEIFEVQEIPRSPSGKFEQWISQINKNIS